LIYQSVAISVLNKNSKLKAKNHNSKLKTFLYGINVGVGFIRPETGSMNRTPTIYHTLLIIYYFLIYEIRDTYLLSRFHLLPAPKR
ncbi:hypothetical protein KKI11_01455, partial [bacterium]|nr:hypothetical protein [bacterium]